MRRLAGLAAALGIAALSGADYQPPSVVWKYWTVDLQCHPLGLRGHYPLRNLLDEDPATAWVFEHPPKHPSEDSLPPGDIKTPYQMTFTADSPVLIDRIEIMNGYNKSRSAFRRNNRALRIEVSGYNGYSDEDRPVAVKTWLKDTMGWHAIRVPAQRYQSLTLVFSGIRRGPDNDLALSGLRFSYRGKQVPWHLPQAAMMTHGSECG